MSAIRGILSVSLVQSPQTDKGQNSPIEFESRINNREVSTNPISESRLSPKKFSIDLPMKAEPRLPLSGNLVTIELALNRLPSFCSALLCASHSLNLNLRSSHLMHRLLTIALLALIGLSGCGVFQPPVVGSGKAVTETRSVASFNEVKLVGGGEVVFEKGSESSVTVTIDDNLLPLLKTEVSNGVLSINYIQSTSTSLPLKIKLSGEQIDSLHLVGGGKFELGKIDQESLKIELVGGSEVLVSGAVNSLNASIVGAGRLESPGLVTQNTEVQITGSGFVAVHAEATAKLKIVGSGDIKVTGPATVDKNIVGSGNVEHLADAGPEISESETESSDSDSTASDSVEE